MAKGSDNERQKCKEWSIWWSKGLKIDPPRDDIFWRTAGSGARATARMKQGKSTYKSYGDMLALDPIGEPLIKRCTIEFKKGYNSLSILDCVDGRGKKYILKRFLDKVCVDAFNAGGNEPILIIHRDYHEPCIFMRSSFMMDLKMWFGKIYVADYAMIKSYTRPSFVAFQLKYFFEHIHPEYFLKED